MSEEITTTIRTLGQARFDMAGQFLGYPVLEAPDASPIRHGLAKRLFFYAKKRVTSTGITIRDDWAVEIETTDAELPASERSYSVSFRTHAGAEIGIQCIVTKRGWPILDHGIFFHES